jgi:hypothetical protein
MRKARLLQRYNNDREVLNMWLEISERNRCGQQSYNEPIDEYS